MTDGRLGLCAVRHPTKAEIGAWLKRAREKARDSAEPDKRADYAQASVATRLGVRERAVRMWEKGKTAPPADQFLDLVLFYRADILELLARKYTGKPATSASGGEGGTEEPERTRRTG